MTITLIKPADPVDDILFRLALAKRIEALLVRAKEQEENED